MSTPPPSQPTPSEIMQKGVADIKRLLGLDVNRLAIGKDIEGIVTTGNPFGPVDYTITGVSVIEFVNVTASVVSGTQTGS